ncbi:MAG: hypothetical protein RBS36_05790 [Thiomicrospira sp.]|jgi:hypothetical protein|nr:hypothetical protein [Thiomicrospira sp.]
MPSFVYPQTTAAMMRGEVNLETAPLRAALAIGSYNPTITDPAVIADLSWSVPLTGCTVVSEIAALSVDNLTFENPSPETYDALLIYIDAALPEDRKPLCWVQSGAGFPVVSFGAPIEISWPTNQRYVFRFG